MNYNNEDEKRDEGGPVTGNIGAAFKKPSFFGKTPAFSKAAGTVMDRLKKLSKKDIAFVAVGLGVLVMAPVAEYMMSAPDSAAQLTPGFGQRSEGGNSLYEPGINALSQGSPDGSGEVITPLSSRDPASLILGPQSSAPPAAPPIPPNKDYRDAMKDSARAAFVEASKAAGAPTIIPRAQSVLRGMGFSGESTRTGGLSGGRILDEARNASGKAASHATVGPVATGYKGVASNVPNSSSKDAFEKLRGQADKAAGNFNGSSAVNSLDKAAADSADIGKGTGGLGAGSESEKNKPPTGSSIQDKKNSNDKETLAETLAKNAALEAQKWEFYKQYEIPKKMIEAVLTGVGGVITDYVKDTVGTALGTNTPAAKCYNPPSCPTGTNCFTVAQSVWGKDWGKHSFDELCFMGGKPIPVSFAVGDKAAVSQTKLCYCNGVKDPNAPPASAAPAAPPAAPGAPAAPDLAPGSTDPAVAALSGFDDTLKMMLADIQAGVDATTINDLLKNTQKVAGGFRNLRLDRVANAVQAGARSVKEKELKDYQRKIVGAQTAVSRIQTAYKEFQQKFDKVVAASEITAENKGGLKFRSGFRELAYTPDKPANSEEMVKIKLFLKQKQRELTSGDAFILEATRELEFNQKAFESYTKQADYVINNAGRLGEEYTGSVAVDAARVSEELDSIKDPAANRNIIIRAFKNLSGRSPGIEPAAGLDTSAMAMNTSGTGFRDAVAASSPAPLIYNAYLWRGLPKEAPVKGKELNDFQAIIDERTAWQVVTPRNKKTTEDILSTDNLAKNSMLAPLIRGVQEIPEDARESASYPLGTLSRLSRLTDLISEIQAYLIKNSIDIDNPTGSGPAPEPPAPAAPVVNNAAADLARQYRDGISKDEDALKKLKADYLALPADIANKKERDHYKEHKASAEKSLGDMATVLKGRNAIQEELEKLAKASPPPTDAQLNIIKQKMEKAQGSFATPNALAGYHINEARRLAGLSALPNNSVVQQPAKPNINQTTLMGYQGEITSRNATTRTAKAALRVAMAEQSAALDEWGKRKDRCDRILGDYVLRSRKQECLDKLQARLTGADKNLRAVTANFSAANETCRSYFKGLPKKYQEVLKANKFVCE